MRNIERPQCNGYSQQKLQKKSIKLYPNKDAVNLIVHGSIRNSMVTNLKMNCQCNGEIFSLQSRMVFVNPNDPRQFTVIKLHCEK